ncbi:zinc finger MYM-type protein 5-like [Rhopalosiphum maidis]|uniref:zinc finger MYM-type protein 5-like n=1 Tax=Rhopalosiphum maidis TaxID=43146 RepID=UPI000F003C10|nr:zinc finger MYM-type protein 5-like [Rhopalosiphum maidis]
MLITTNKDQPPCKRSWLSYSPALNKVFCVTCKMFGLPKAKRLLIASQGTNEWSNIKRNIEQHELLPEHLQSKMSKALYTNNHRIDLKMVHGTNKQVAENREIVKVVINALLYTARQNIALQGHNEHKLSNNRGNFLELINLMESIIQFSICTIKK